VVSKDGSRAARVDDVHDLALAMPHVTVVDGTSDNPVYQVGGKSFVFFRNPRPDAVDPETGERYAVLHHRPLRRPPVGTPPGQSRRRADPQRTGRGDPGRVAVPGISAPSGSLAHRTPPDMIISAAPNRTRFVRNAV
jgi:hypothetical protein